MKNNRFYNVLRSLESLQAHLGAESHCNQHAYNGIPLWDHDGNLTAVTMNDFVCYDWKKSKVTSETILSFDEMISQLPRYWKKNAEGEDVPQILVSFTMALPIAVLFDPSANPFDIYHIFTDEIMSAVTDIFEPMTPKNSTYRVWDIIHWFLNDVDVFADDILRNSYSSSAASITHVISASIYAAIYDTIEEGLLLFYDYQDGDYLYIPFNDYFVVAFTKHLWMQIGGIAYPRGEAYEWDYKLPTD